MPTTVTTRVTPPVLFLGRTGWCRRTGMAALTLGLAVLAGCQSNDTGLGPQLAANSDVIPPSQREARKAPATERVSPLGHYLASRYAMNRRDLRRAAAFLEPALEADPDYVGLLRRAFIVELGLGQIDKAADMAERLVKQDAEPALAKLVLSVKALAEDRAEDALALLADEPLERLNTVLLPMVRAWLQLDTDASEKAIGHLIDPEKPLGSQPLFDLHAAMLYDIQGKKEDALKAYMAVKGTQERLSLRFVEAIGNFLERYGDPKKAKAVYVQYRTQNPDSVLFEEAIARIDNGTTPEPMVMTAEQGLAEALFDIASLLHQERQSDQALLYIQMALYLRPNLTVAQMTLGEILLQQGRYEEAIEAFNTISPDSPFRWTARLSIADAYDVLDETDQAISMLESMAGERPERYDALSRIGNLLRSRERFAEAAQAYDRAIERIGAGLEERHWALLYARGIALERSKQWPRAEKDFLRALELEPEQPYVLNYLGYSWVEKGHNLDQAQSMIERAVEQRPNDGYIVDSLGWVLYQLGNFEEAVIHLERAVELRPQDPIINDHLGDAYWRVDRYNEARFQWRRALSLEPEPDLVETIETKLKQGLGATVTADRKM